MSILIGNINLPLEAGENEAVAAALDKCGLCASDVRHSGIYRSSIDARRGRIRRVVSVLLDLDGDEAAAVARIDKPDIRLKTPMEPPRPTGQKALEHRPVVVGFGPGGLFAAYVLAVNGYRPLVLERGQRIEERDAAVETFFSGGAFHPASNIQFGEGGAGAYSDGKLTTRINDPRSEYVLQVFASHGAPEEILHKAKPHIGTDILKSVVKAMRNTIIACGGSVQFETPLTGLRLQNGALHSIQTPEGEIPCERLILAIGHSARDTFPMLLDSGVYLEAKPFSVGARIEHAQRDIDRGLYGKQAGHPLLPPAEYTLSHRENGRACYTFCMCPGGQVVAAQSEEHSVVTNGMSYHARNGRNANAALVVSVSPEDYGGTSPLAGIEFQRRIERAAYAATGSCRAPCQRVEDFLAGRPTKQPGRIQPTYPLGVEYGTLEGILPDYVMQHMRSGLSVFGRKIRGFDAADALLTGPETRTSSPVRMTREESLHSRTVEGLLPCGEGAGYAGGIMSAAVDGIRCAQEIMNTYRPFD